MYQPDPRPMTRRASGAVVARTPDDLTQSQAVLDGMDDELNKEIVAYAATRPPGNVGMLKFARPLGSPKKARQSSPITRVPRAPPAAPTSASAPPRPVADPPAPIRSTVTLPAHILCGGYVGTSSESEHERKKRLKKQMKKDKKKAKKAKKGEKGDTSSSSSSSSSLFSSDEEAVELSEGTLLTWGAHVDRDLDDIRRVVTSMNKDGQKKLKKLKKKVKKLKKKEKKSKKTIKKLKKKLEEGEDSTEDEDDGVDVEVKRAKRLAKKEKKKAQKKKDKARLEAKRQGKAFEDNTGDEKSDSSSSSD